MTYFKSVWSPAAAALLACISTSCATTKISECSDPPQSSPQEPDYVQHPEKPLTETELTDAQKARYANRQTELKTLPVYHDIVLHPQATLEASTLPGTYSDLVVDAPIFLVGLEKPRARAPEHMSGKGCKGRDFTLEALPEDIFDSVCFVLKQNRPQLLTHIAMIDGVANGHYGKASLLYNAYDEPLVVVPHEDSDQRDEALYERGLEMLRTLSSEVQKTLAEKNATDVVVLSTGWNTRQRETLYNTMDWIAQIGAARAKEGRPYRPVYITISWQSAWEQAALRPLAVITKGNDADEVGLTWINRLVHDVVIPAAAQKGLPVTFVGHSYGTRVLGSALYMRDVIRRPPPPALPPMAFVALQPAFPINRFGMERGKERWFAGVDPHALVVLTSSEYDTATSLPPWGRYAGGGGAKERVLVNKDGNLSAFGCEVLDADASGRIVDPSRLTEQRPHLVNANAFISCHMPQSGGGAHSDVFDQSAGRLISQVMESAATSNGTKPASDSRCK